MRILYINDAVAIYGGLERVLVEKINWLVEQDNYEVWLLTANQGDHPLSFPLHSKAKYDDLGIFFYRQYHQTGWKRLVKKRQLHRLFRERLAEKINTISPDIIVCTRLEYLHDIVRVKGTIPLVFESHTSRWISRFEGDGFIRRLYVWYLQLAVFKIQRVVALTNGDANEWRKLTTRVSIIPNIVHLNESGMYSNCKSCSVIFVGRFSKQKDVGCLLHIWKIIHQRYPDWYLYIYSGYGEQQDAMLQEIQKMDANIIVPTPTANMMERYRECSVLLLTSIYEPFGLVIPEAMSCGLPVVAFDCPYGPKDIITDGIDGFLIEHRSIVDFVDKVCLLIEDEETRVKMGQAGVKTSKRYDVRTIMPLWKDLFEQLARSK